MAVRKNNQTQPAGTGAGAFRKADIASMEAYNLTQPKDQTTPTWSGGVVGGGNLGGTGINDVIAYFKAAGLLGGGGSGSDYARKKKGMDTYITGLRKMMQAGPTNTALYDTLSKVSDVAAGNIGSSYDALMKSLSDISNPFAGYQTQAVSSPTAGLEQFLTSQNVGTDDLTRFAELQRTQSEQQAQAANNLMAQLGGIFQGGQQSRLAEAQMGRTADVNELALNKLLMEAQLRQQGQSQMDELRKLLLEAQMQRASL